MEAAFSYSWCFSSQGSSLMCGHGLSGSPLVHRILRSPLFFPSVKNVPTFRKDQTDNLEYKKVGACNYLITLLTNAHEPLLFKKQKN